MEKSNEGRLILTQLGKEWLKSFRPLETSLKTYSQTIENILNKSKKLSLAIEPSLSLTRFIRAVINKSESENLSQVLDICHHRMTNCCIPEGIDAFLTFSPPKKNELNSQLISRRKLWMYRSKKDLSNPPAEHTSILVPPSIIQHCCAKSPYWSSDDQTRSKTCIPAPCSSESLQLVRNANYTLVSLGIEDDLIPDDVQRFETENHTDVDIYLVTRNSSLTQEKMDQLDSIFDTDIY